MFDAIDFQAQSIPELFKVDSDTLPEFVTDNVNADALGYHTAYTVQGEDDDAIRVQAFIYTSWLDPAEVPPIFADVSNHVRRSHVGWPLGSLERHESCFRRCCRKTAGARCQLGSEVLG